ncbi:MAG: 16S rRNA (uracil(1498)-N(3))-methyltransferase [Gammaproteobacteria bacterium]
MRNTRVHHPAPLADDTEFELMPGAARHLVRVLRLSDGDAFTVFDGSGTEWPAVLIGEQRARTGRARVAPTESPLLVTLVQGISRGERMDWTLQKAVELGVSRIVPVVAERTTVRLSGERTAKRVAHWSGVVVAACEQSGRNRVPVLDPVQPLAAWLETMDTAALVLDPAAAHGLREFASLAPDFTLLVGPEGGFSDRELVAARAAGCTGVRLGPRVLRTETAGVAALAALQALYGDLSGA